MNVIVNMTVNGDNFVKFLLNVVASTSVLEMDAAMVDSASVRMVGMGSIAASLPYLRH
jgi:hypothetical protein